MTNDQLNSIATQIVDACYVVHKEMGPGLLESVYEMCLMHEFKLRNINARNQVLLHLIYKGVELSKEFRIDILVEEEIIMELKSSEIMHPVYEAQILSYMKLADKKLGFLVNFNVPIIKNGIKRFVNNF